MPFMKQLISIILIFIFTLCNLNVSGQGKESNNYFILFTDTIKDEYGYKNQNGEILIELGKYSICYTDTFKTYAIVLKHGSGFVAIDRQQNILYNVFPFDNGPDYPSEVLFRIKKDNKIGYADSSTGTIIIKPQFDCAYPFKNGIAKVSIDCIEKPQGVHHVWMSENWFYIDKNGRHSTKNK